MDMDSYHSRLYFGHRALILNAVSAILVTLGRFVELRTRHRRRIRALKRDRLRLHDIHIPSLRLSLDNMLDDDIRLKFRFTKLQLQILAEELLLPEFIITESRYKAHKLEALCLLLRRLAYPNRLYDLVVTFGRSRQH
ncbi:hypothetical protein V1507DRAFT_14204 [Lipomyces tetrasporus]